MGAVHVDRLRNLTADDRVLLPVCLDLYGWSHDVKHGHMRALFSRAKLLETEVLGDLRN